MTRLSKQEFFNVVLQQPNSCGKKRCNNPNHRNNHAGGFADGIKHVGAHHHKDACGNHGRCVNERRHRSWPAMASGSRCKAAASRLAHGADKQKQGDCGYCCHAGCSCLFKHFGIADAAKRDVNKNNTKQKPRSPIRFITKAFLAALLYAVFLYQKPISRYEQRPTPSQPTNVMRKLLPRTSSNIKNTKRLR